MFWRVYGMIRSQIQPVFVTEGPTHPLKGTRGQVNNAMTSQIHEAGIILLEIILSRGQS